VIVVVPSAVPLTGSDHALRLAESLVGRGLDVRLIVLDWRSRRILTSASWTPPGAAVETLCWRGQWDAHAAMRVRRTVAATNPGAIYVAERRVGQFLRRALVGLRHQCTVIDLDGPADVPADVPTTGADAPVPQRSAVRDELLRSLRLPAETLLIGTAAALEPPSRLKDAIWALDLLQCVRQDVQWVVIGRGSQARRLVRFSYQANVAPRCHWLGERADGWRLIAALDVYWQAHASRMPTDGIIAAWRAGVPVLAARSGSGVAAVDPDRTGGEFPLGARRQLARQTLRLLQEPQFTERIVAGGRAAAVGLERTISCGCDPAALLRAG